MAIAPGPDGAMWFATTAGLFRLADATPAHPERVTVPGTRPDTRYISMIAVDGRLWVAGELGVAVLERGRWHLFDRGAGFRASTMRHVIRRRDGRMCVSFTDVDGLTCFRSDGISVSELRDISLADGLTSGRIYFLGEDSEERLWIGTGEGVDVVTAGGVDHFSETDGLAGNDSAARAFFEDDDRSVWLGASTGLSHVLAQHYHGPPVPPRTALVHSLLGGQSIHATAGAQVQVPHDRNAVAVRFTADSFVAPARLEYQVRLSPLEREWSTTRMREARYPALPPGAYQLEMRSRIGAGAWGRPAELSFAILPAWWQTRWFIVLAGAVVLAMLGGAAADQPAAAAVERELPRPHRVDARPGDRPPRRPVDLPEPGGAPDAGARRRRRAVARAQPARSHPPRRPRAGGQPAGRRARGRAPARRRAAAARRRRHVAQLRAVGPPARARG
jgi:hypothetical protein